jgi:hypothetical protein
MFPTMFEFFNYILPSPFTLIAFVFFAFGIGLHLAVDNIKNRFGKNYCHRINNNDYIFT